jgi:hypothetical protein
LRAGGQSQRAGGIQRVLAPEQKIAPWVMEHTSHGQRAEFFVVLADQPDLARPELCTLKTKRAATCITRSLTRARPHRANPSMAARTRNRASLLYIVNAILVKGTREIAEALAARSECGTRRGQPLIHNNLPQPVLLLRCSRGFSVRRRLSRESFTRMRLTWALGYIGQNIVIGSEDTGVRWTHNA